MKKLIFAIVAVAFITLTAFTIVATNKSGATVDQKEGLYIFIHSKPTAEYDYLGSVSRVLGSGPDDMLNGLVKKVKKDFPTADGIIFTTEKMDKADAVKFKD